MDQIKRPGRLTALLLLLGLTFRMNPWWSAGTLALTLAMGGLPALQVTALRGLMNQVDASLRAEIAASGPLATWMIWLTVALVLPNLVYSLVPVLQAGYRESNGHKLRLAVMQRIASLDALTLEDPRVRDQLQRVDHALNRAVQPWSESMVWFFQALMSVVALSGFLVQAHWSVLLLAIAGGLAHLWVEARVHAGQYQLFSAQTPLQRWEAYMVELMTTAAPRRDLLVFGAAPGILRRWRTLTAALRREQWGLERRNAWLSLGGRALFLTVYLLPLVILAWRYSAGLIDIGLVIGLVSALASFYGSLNLLVFTAGGWFSQGMHAADLLTFMAASSPAEAEPTVAQPGRSNPRRRRGLQVAVTDLSFTYPGAAAPALQGINLQIRPGEWVAVVGENGSGKSTLARLILGLYSPTCGQVAVGASPAGRPGTAAAVMQEYGRYSLSLRENIGLGHLPLLHQDQHLQEAAMAAGANRLLPMQEGWLEHQLGREFDGLEPSGGQWQRLAVARGLLAPAGLVVLDEATSALDAEAEDRLLRGLRSKLKGATVLFVAHRLPVTRLADRIIVMSGGKIAEEGTHEALLAGGGLYAQFYRAQADWYHPRAEMAKAANRA